MLEGDVEKRGRRSDDVLPVYAARVARMIFLRHSCGNDHPVLRSEMSLVEMARSKLREQILSGGAAAMADERTTKELRSIILSCLGRLVQDEDVLRGLIPQAEYFTVELILKGPEPSRDRDSN